MMRRVIGVSGRLAHAGSMLSATRMTFHITGMKYESALKSIAARYCPAMLRSYRTDRASVFPTPGDPGFDGPAPDWRASTSILRNPHDQPVQDDDRRGGVCRDRHLRVLASRLGIQSGHGLYACRAGQD